MATKPKYRKKTTKSNPFWAGIMFEKKRAKLSPKKTIKTLRMPVKKTRPKMYILEWSTKYGWSGQKHFTKSELDKHAKDLSKSGFTNIRKTVRPFDEFTPTGWSRPH